jgi:predicted metal-dependent phosphoesterase TrpH
MKLPLPLPAALAFLLFASLAGAQVSRSLVLEGDVHGTQNQTYIEIPFQVPADVHRISVDFSYTKRDQRTTMDLAILDPQRFRGASGGNKSHFTISETDATPSYLAGPIPAGQWKLLLAVPNIRAGVVSHYRADISFNNSQESHSFANAALSTSVRWYRGDLHMHTAHSDGSCSSQSGKRVPCPVFLTAQVAADRGLDFIAVTDHNTVSQYDALREIQPYFDKLLLIPGREITTFWGHFNIFGAMEFIDYRKSVDQVVREAQREGAIASVNHADAPTGEVCMGCGWTPVHPVDMSLFTGVEVINGSKLSSIDFWEKQLAEGHHVTAIGGSDNHNALIPLGKPNAIGYPTTVVQAAELSVNAILDSIRRGRAFVDVTSSHDKLLDVDAATSSMTVHMGEDISVLSGTRLQLIVHVAACSGDTVDMLVDGRTSAAMPPVRASSKDDKLTMQWTSDGKRHWIRAEVRDRSGDLVLLGNPVYVNFPTR